MSRSTISTFKLFELFPGEENTMDFTMGPEQRAASMKMYKIEVEGMVWLGVATNLILALGHSENRGPTSLLMRVFLHELLEYLLSWGVLTDEEMKILRILAGDSSQSKTVKETPKPNTQ